MKYIITFVLFTNLIFSQINNGKVTYKVIVTEDKEATKENPLIKDYYLKEIGNANKIEFSLAFDSTNSFFNIIEKLELDNQSSLFALKLTKFNGAINQKITNNYILEKEYFNGINYIVNNTKTNWVLLNESKKIGNYECFKAKITYKDSLYSSFKEEKEVVAWYCPKIPFPFGPLGFGSLPGLILELQYSDVVYGVSKLDLNNTDLKITTFDDKKSITTEEYKDIIEKFTK